MTEPAWDVRSEAGLLACYDAAADDVYRYARRLAERPEVASDLLQEAFLTLLRQARAGTIETVSVGWLITTVRHRYLNMMRAQERERRRLELAAVDRSDDVRPGDAADLLAGMSERERSAVVLRYVDGVALSIGGLVWLAGGDDAEPPATEVPEPTAPVTPSPTTAPQPSTVTVPTTPKRTPSEPIETDVVVPATGGDPLDPEVLSTVPYGEDEGQILRPAGPLLAVRVGDRLLLVETGADEAPTGKVLEIEPLSGDVTRSLTLPVPAQRSDFAVYGSPNGVLYMSWRDAPSDDIIWTPAVEERGSFVLGTPARTGPLESDDPTLAKPAARVTGDGLLVGEDLVVPSPLPAHRPAIRISVGSDHIIEGTPVAVLSVMLGDPEDADAHEWLVNVRSDAVGVRGSESLYWYQLGMGVLVEVRRPGAEDYYVTLPVGDRPAGFRSDGWRLAGTDGSGASFVRTTETGIEIGALAPPNQP